jgi:CubicO group peptidase (beta-lactamase class C family)
MKLLLLLGCAVGCAVLCLGADKSERFDTNDIDPDAAGMSSKRLAAIPLRMKEFVEEGTTSGMVTIVARHGHVASFEATGYQDLEKKKPMRKDTLFRIASLTKPVTCAGIMTLVDEGRLALIDPVEKYLPEYRGLKMNACGARSGYNCALVAPSRLINIEDLMAHVSGLPAGAPEAPGAEPAKTLAERVSRGAKATLLFEPGTAWNYSNIGIDILGRVIEVVAKQPFDEFLQERIFAPLGMKDTSFVVPPEKQDRMVVLYGRSHEGKLEPVEAVWGKPGTVPVPAGGLISTATDMLQFNEMMRNKGTLNGKRVLSAAAVTLMTTSHTGDMKAGWVPGVGHGYGYEVVRDVTGMYRYNSLGSYVKGGAYRTYEWVDPEKDMDGVFMMQRNTGGSDTADEINAFMSISAAAIEK